MKIGIIGLGHIGLPIARFLHSAGFEVLSWSNTYNSYPWLHSINLQTMAETKLDYLVIASGGARPGQGDYFTEMDSTVKLIPDSVKQTHTRIIYLSSGAIYGECIRPKSEKDRIQPTTTYGQAKAFAEDEFIRLYKNRFISLRIGNIIDWDNPYGILASAQVAKVSGYVDLFGMPDDCRDYLHIDDLCITVSKIIELGLRESILNVGSGRSISLKEFKKFLNTALPQVDVRWNDSKNSNVSKTLLNVSKVQELTKYIPSEPNTLFEDYFHRLV